MRSNVFQKILALLYLCLITIPGLFYVPFRNISGRYQNELVYDAIWSNNSDIDLYRVGIYLMVLSIICAVLYSFLAKLGDMEPTQYKRRAKIELMCFIIFIAGTLFCFLFLVGTNGFNQINRKALTQTIEKCQNSIVDKTTKRLTRFDFWKMSLGNFTDVGNSIPDFWASLIVMGKNENDLTYFFSNCNKDDLRRFGIDSPHDLKQFIEHNTYNEEDLKNQIEVRELENKINLSKTKKANLTFYEDGEIRKVVLICMSILLLLLFILRPLVIFIKSIFLELK